MWTRGASWRPCATSTVLARWPMNCLAGRPVVKRSYQEEIGMRRIVLFGLFGAMLLTCGLPAAAQERPQAEVFLGGSFLRQSSTNYGGWSAGITGNVNSWLGVTADFSGHYNSPLSVYTY